MLESQVVTLRSVDRTYFTDIEGFHDFVERRNARPHYTCKQMRGMLRDTDLVVVWKKKVSREFEIL